LEERSVGSQAQEDVGTRAWEMLPSSALLASSKAALLVPAREATASIRSCLFILILCLEIERRLTEHRRGLVFQSGNEEYMHAAPGDGGCVVREMCTALVRRSP